MSNHLSGYAVLWDMDGTLVDSGTLHRRAWRRFLQQQGQPVTDAIFEQGFGHAEVLHQRDVGRADISARSAFEAIIQMIISEVNFFIFFTKADENIFKSKFSR